MKGPTDPPALRQALAQIERERRAPIGIVFSARGRLVRASLSETSKVCGKRSCCCARGEKHPVVQLSWVEAGRRRSAHVRAADLAALRPAVERYRTLRQARAQLARLSDETLALIDRLSELLSEPPAQRRARRARR